MKKVLFTATLVRGHITKFHIPFLKLFKEMGWETWVAAKNDTQGAICDIPYCDHFINIDFCRSPYNFGNCRAYKQLKALIDANDFDIIHTHTPVGSVLTRLAARDSLASVIYTAHGFHFYKGAPIINWLLWFPVEKVLTRYTDYLLTINKEDYARACRMSSRHCIVKYVHGVGVDVPRYRDAIPGGVSRSDLGFTKADVIVLAVGDLVPNKNHIEIIKAFRHLPNDFKLVIAGEGKLESYLETEIENMGLSSRVKLLGFRNDIPELMKITDCLCFPSFHEGLPVSVMEAMASGLVVVASSIRGITPDLIVDGVNGFLLANNDSEEICKTLRNVLDANNKNNKIISAAVETIDLFSLDSVLVEMQKIYEEAATRK